MSTETEDTIEVEGRKISRRTFNQLLAGGVLTVGIASNDKLNPIGTAEASVGGVLYEPTIASGKVTEWMYGSVNDPQDNVDMQPTSDRIALHGLAMSTGEWWNGITRIILNNRLEDLRMVGNVNGRAQIADSWEDGRNATETRSDVYEAIEETFDTPYRNTCETLATCLAQVAGIKATANEAEEINDRFVSFSVRNEEHSAYDDNDLTVIDGAAYISETPRDVEFELPSGTTFTTQMPRIVRNWNYDGDSDGDVDSELNMFPDEMLEYYDSEEEWFMDVPCSDGTVNFQGGFTVMSVADADLESHSFLQLAEFADYLHRVEQAAEEAKANYDVQLIEDLFELLDEGLITPNEIRGVEGMAEHLSGTTDATSNRYMMALMSLFGLDRSDLSDIASMSVDYEGYTNIDIVRDDDGNIEETSYSAMVEDSFEGQLFADLIGDTVLSSEMKYITKATSAYPSDSASAAIYNALTGLKISDIEGHSTGITDVALLPDNSAIALLSNSSYTIEVSLVDVETGEQIWFSDFDSSSNSPQNIVCDPTGTYLAVGSDGSVDYPLIIYDVESGSRSATFEDGSMTPESYQSDYLAWTATGEYVSISGGSGGEPNGAIFTASLSMVHDGDGSSIYNPIVGGDNNAIANNSSDSLVFYEVDENGLSELWEDSREMSVGAISSESSYIATVNGDMVTLYDGEGSRLWERSKEDVGIGSVRDIGFVINQTAIYLLGTGGERSVALLSVENGESDVSIASDYEPAGGSNATYDFYPSDTDDADYDGILGRATMFDVPSGGEYELVNGELSITMLTDNDGNELDPEEEYGWTRPEDDNVDTEEYREYIEYVHNELGLAIEAEREYRESGGGGGNGDDDSDWLDWFRSTTFGVPNWGLGLGGMMGLGYLGQRNRD